MYVVEEFKGLSKRLSNGSLDSAFGDHGYISDYVSNAAAQTDGKVVTAGAGGLGRYTTEGKPDTSFAEDGKQATELNIYAIAIQRDGRIVVAGSGLSNNYLTVARYNTDGSPDTAFDSDGLVQSNLSYNSHLYNTTAIALQNDGKIVVAGGFSIIRYNADGSVDQTLNGNGIQAFEAFNSVAVQDDGKIAAIGLKITQDPEDSDAIIIDYSVCRFTADGNFDSSFSIDGQQPATTGTASLALQSDEKIVTVASYAMDFEVTRYKTDGSFDSSFSDDGRQTTGFGNGPSEPTTVVIQADGKIVAGGSTYYRDFIAIARYNQDGSLDKSFDKDGKVVDATKVGRTVYKSTAIQKDGKAVVAGTTYSGLSSEDNLAIARYNTDGSLDNTFSKNGVLITGVTLFDADAINVVVQSDGKIIAASEYGRILLRYNNNGSTDSSFIYRERQPIRSLALQSDGKIVVESYTDYGTFEITRFNTDGSLDSAFGQNGKQTVVFYDKDNFTLQGYFTSLSIDSNGKIVVGGIASNDYPYGNSLVALARLNKNGSFDNTFSNDGNASFSLTGATSSLLAIQKDGRIVIGSAFADLNSHEGVVLKRFNNDGSIDSSFNGNTPLHYNLYSVDRTSIAIQSDGKILLGGSDLVRLNANGGADSTFDIIAGRKVDFYINDIAVSGNKLYAAGGGIFGTVARYLLNDDTTATPPTVSLTAPSDNAAYIAPVNLQLAATAADADGTITKVEFYNDSTLLYTDTAAPYAFTWKSTPSGNYTLTAKATNNSGLTATSTAVHVSVIPNKAPTVSIINPVNNRTFAAPAYIHFEALASDIDGRITRVEFYSDSTLLATEYKPPYKFVWKNLPVGIYTVTAVAADNFGAQTTSAPVTVKVKAFNPSIVSSKPNAETNVFNAKTEISLKAWPNPANKTLTISANGLQQNKPTTISILSATGVVMKTIRINNSTTQLDVSSLTSGVYTIKLLSGDKVLYKQFVKL